MTPAGRGAVLLGLVAFAGAAVVMASGVATQLEADVMRSMGGGGPVLDGLAIFAAYGLGAIALAGATALIVAVLVWRGRRREAIVVALAMGIVAVASELLKQLIGRARPELQPWLVSGPGLSFPSGHAMSNVVFWALIADLGAEHLAARRRPWLALAAALLAVGVGLARIYAGVHWPTDVVAGWGLGLAIAALAIGARRRQKFVTRTPPA